MQLILYSPVFAHRIGKTFHIGDGGQEIPRVYAGFLTLCKNLYSQVLNTVWAGLFPSYRVNFP